MSTRILTGDRPTGALHLGHYFGTLANRVRLQADGYDVFVVVADYQVINDRDHPGDIRATVLDLVLDYVAAGLDPERSTTFAHSAVPALHQLMLPLLSLVGMGELSRNPTVKDEIRLAGRSTVSGLMMTYPVHQAADILFCKADLVPVGRDQLPHLELTRSIARRFNDRYGAVFPVPEPILGQVPVLLGMDGRKMSKSLHNGISLRDSPDEVAAKVRAARTDSERHITFEPDRRPEVANLLTLSSLCSGDPPASIAAQIGNGGAAALKDALIAAVTGFLRPMQERRATVSRVDAERILQAGATAASDIADATLGEVRTAMGMNYAELTPAPVLASMSM
jgi:tryptophanyl-tRNA synthetase